MLNYGFWHSYWCYAYERFNRQIASFYTSRRTVEFDMLNYINQQIEIYKLLDQIKPILISTAQASLDYLQNEQLAKGTLAIYNYTIPKIIEFQYSITNINFFVTRSEDYSGRLIKPFFEAYLSNKNLKLLVDYYTKIYSNNNLKFYAKNTKYNKNNTNNNNELVPISHTLCFVDWFNQSNISQINYFLLLNDLDLKDMLPLAEIWEAKFQTRSYENFFPVQKILCKFVRGNYKLNNQSKLVILSLNNK
ncbi:transposase domain-containing protein [Gigaspora margarita]|uniref:Transposase domain-containing protein n=1 Tax=Gigaspora margarita TaxID=4874 RepID=A0A8H4ETQ8_GIGMA|nr:transposase domain-containing protein [Gigaspora margarita]